MLKAVAMVTSSPRITVPLCLATEREKAMGRECGCGEEGSACVGWGGSIAKMFPQEISRTTESSAEVFRSVIALITKMSHISIYCPFAWA